MSFPSFPLPEEVSDTETNSQRSSKTVVVLGNLVAELEAPSEQNIRKHVPDSAFVHAKRDGEIGKVEPEPQSFPLSVVPSSCGGNDGGGPFSGMGGDNKPNAVADTFKLEHIGGLQEHKEYLKRSIILPLARPEILKDWGVSPPKGILLHGPPGTGKTFMAKALVNELKKELRTRINFFYHKGGDVFNMYHGESERKLRQVFDTAKRMSPSVLFFDEIDGLCPSREGSSNHGTDVYSSVVTCFLGQMDGLENGKVFVIAATNRLDAVDPAARRPGRFDKHLAFGFPDDAARRKIIEIHTTKWSRADQLSPELLYRLAQRTRGYTGADLEKLCKDVVYVAIKANKGVINDALKITENHWRQAMSGMQRTAADTFGSSLFMPTKPDLIVSKLIQPVVDEVTEKIRPMLSASSLKLYAKEFVFLCKSFLVQITPLQSASFLNDQILHGILSSALFNNMSLFEINTSALINKVQSGTKPGIMDGILDVVQQAEEAQLTENCAVVVVLNINELLQKAEPKRVLRALAKIRGPKMFLFATSSMPLGNLKDRRLTDLFLDRYMQIQNPSNPALQQFFEFVLTPKKEAYPAKVALLNSVAAKATKLAHNHGFEHILNFSSALQEMNMENLQTDNALTKAFNKIFEKYKNSKL